MAEHLTLSLLDFGTLRAGQSPRQLIRETLLLATEAEELGYARYWLAEHQTLTCAWASPELVLPLLAAKTKLIRVGTAGILLRFYNPLKLASDFSLLEHLFPDRIDLGLARGSPGQNCDALLGGSKEGLGVGSYADKISDLLGYVTDSIPAAHPHAGAKAIPFPPLIPEVWVLGSSISSATIASRSGTAFGYSLFHSPDPDPGAVRKYAAEFQPSPWLSAPKSCVAFAGVCADTDEEARKILEGHRNESIFPTVVGSPQTCRGQLLKLRQTYPGSEFIFLDLSQSFEDRLRSYRLLMSACSP